jgi:hypothetical protein
MVFTITNHNSLPFSYKNHCYQIYKPKQGGHNIRGLKRMFNLIEVILSYYSRALVARIDLHPTYFSSDNKIMSKFLKSYIPKLEKQYKCKVIYFCAREQNTSHKQHYHLALMLSGHMIQHSEKLLTQLKSAWEECNAGTATFVERPFYIMYRGDKPSIVPVIYRLSYLTKEYTKELNRPAHDYLCNKIKLSVTRQDELSNDVLLVDPLITHRHYQQSQEKQHKGAMGFSSFLPAKGYLHEE